MEIGIKHTTDSLDVENKALIIAVETKKQLYSLKKTKEITRDTMVQENG